MKPSWDDAPEWANWLAMDQNGIWRWHEYEPRDCDVSGAWEDFENYGKSEMAKLRFEKWEQTLEQRK